MIPPPPTTAANNNDNPMDSKTDNENKNMVYGGGEISLRAYTNIEDFINSNVIQGQEQSTKTNPIVSVEEFFHGNPNTPWKPSPEHDLKQSPCRPIIGIKNDYKIRFYYCKLHPSIENTYLETIEHHCKYKEPDKHKAEILRLMRGRSST